MRYPRKSSRHVQMAVEGHGSHEGIIAPSLTRETVQPSGNGDTYPTHSLSLLMFIRQKMGRVEGNWSLDEDDFNNILLLSMHSMFNYYCYCNLVPL